MGKTNDSSPRASPVGKSDPLSLDGSGGSSSPASARLRSSRKGTISSSSSSGSSSCSGSSCSSGSCRSSESGSRADLDASIDQFVEDGLAHPPKSSSGSGKGDAGRGDGGQHHHHHHHHHMIGEWPATALCGCDVMSSCLYTIGLVTQSAGKLAPVAFILVSLVLYLVKSVYAMAVLSFPHNGGSYNLLANVAPKPVAALGASLSIISYIATCVVSGVSACDYLGNVFHLDPVVASVVLLVAFAGLVLIGLKESSSIAFAIWAVHLITLATLAVGCFAYAASAGFAILWLNTEEPYPKVPLAGAQVGPSLGAALFVGFSSAMLGVSGYETTANFVESMHTSTFIRTLRNLWVGVTMINPLLSFLAISVLPIAEISADSDTVLAKMAKVWGDWAFGEGSRMSQLMSDWLSIDAFIVLSGAVLTAFVGVDGLIYQMAQDRVLPAVFLQKNRWRGTNHVIILTFLALCVVLIVAMEGQVAQLAGMYSLAFLGVLTTFILGSMLLKVSPKHAASLTTKGLMVPWWHLSLALGLVAVSLLGNFLGSASVIISFLSYLLPIFALCLGGFYLDKAKAHCCPANARLCFGGGLGAAAASPTLAAAARTSPTGVSLERMETSSALSSAGSSPAPGTQQQKQKQAQGQPPKQPGQPMVRSPGLGPRAAPTSEGMERVAVS